MPRGRRFAFSLAALALVASSAFADTGADLNVSPQRVVFAPNARSSVIYVFNRGDAPATYTISLTDRVMTPDGQVRDASESDVQSAAAAEIARMRSARPLLVYAPRRVTLQPGESQAVRIRALTPPDLTDGEFHTHLTISTVPPESAGLTAEQAAAGEASQVTMRINTLFSISIAVIVRRGEVDVRSALDNIAYAPPSAGRPARVSIDLVRGGASSLYGAVEVRRAGAPHSEAPLGVVRGVAVYPEVDRRRLEIPLTRVPPHGEALEIRFNDDDTRPGDELAEASIVVP
jgi:P pilus assembly chaperone PapD